MKEDVLSYVMKFRVIIGDMEYKKIINWTNFTKASFLLCSMRNELYEVDDIDSMKLLHKKWENFVLINNEFCGSFTVFVGFAQKF